MRLRDMLDESSVKVGLESLDKDECIEEMIEVLVRAGRVADRDKVREAAKRLNGMFGCAVLVKGGHAVGDYAAAEDTLYDGTSFFSATMPWVADPVSTHGTGCSLAAALAAELALGHDLRSAVLGAKRYVHQAIARSYYVGEDCGVLGFVDVSADVPSSAGTVV